eukprot:scaffold33667_cov192-Skeletonema_dohrnii-CCMP3373.AAC.1
MAHSLPDTYRGGPLPHAASGDGSDALVESAVPSGAAEVRDVVSQTVSALIGSIESRASPTADDDASEQSLPLLPEVPVEAGDTIGADVIEEVAVDYCKKNRVNNFYQVQKGNSKKMIPIGPLKLLDTDAEKHSFCLKWRNCASTTEQKALQDSYEAAAQAKMKAAKEAKQRDARMKRKQEQDEKAAKKRRKLEQSAAK